MPDPLRSFICASLAWCASAPSGAAVAQTAGRPLVRQLYGEVAIEARRAEGGAILVAAADARTSVAVRLLPRDLRRWSDSASLVLAARARPPRDSSRWNATVEGPGLEAGSLSLSRSVTPRDTVITLLLADAEFETVRVSLTTLQARAFVAAMRRASAAVAAPPGSRPAVRARPQPLSSAPRRS